MRALESAQLSRLIETLREGGYRVIAPTVRDGAIVYGEVEGVDELPIGWTDEQAPGHYRLRQRDDRAYFGYVVGPHSWKQALLPARETLVQIRRSKDDFEVEARRGDEDAPLALVGVRACELAAMDIQDRVFVDGALKERRYQRRRERALVVAVNCLEPGDLCFCASMDTGPRVRAGFDLCLTEIGDELLVEAGSPRGQVLLDQLSTREAEADAEDRVAAATSACAARMGAGEGAPGRALDTRDLPGLLLGNLDHARWDQVAERCLACGNCTSVCPTCFCFTVADPSGLPGPDGEVTAARERTWDSCFTVEHSQIHGATFRPTIRDRYRQWLTHKLGFWHGQFGTSGCVGCGRCIAWCPVGIDITEEVAAVRADAKPALVMPAPTPPRAAPEGDQDPLVPVPARVVATVRESEGVVTLHVDPPAGYRHRPGQFNMLSLPGVGDVPISISGVIGGAPGATPSEIVGGTLEHTIRAVGAVSEALVHLRPGATLGLRGPFGTSWPVDDILTTGRPAVVIAGGIGLAPLRGTIRLLLDHPEQVPPVRLMYGARTPADILFDQEMLGWGPGDRARVSVTVDRGSPTWTGNVGVVTRLMRRKDLPRDGLYLVCGPEIMMRFVIDTLIDIGVPETSIYLSMERNMKCAAGFCGRCQYGPYFVCKDGPVFRYDQVSFLFGQSGF